jgi:hypothetical protein
MRTSCCLCVSPIYFLNAWTNLYETWYVYHGTWAHFINPSHQSVCLYVYPPIIARQQLS